MTDAARWKMDNLVADAWLGEYGQFNHDKYAQYKKARDATMLAVHVEACMKFDLSRPPGKSSKCGDDWYCEKAKKYREGATDKS